MKNTSRKRNRFVEALLIVVVLSLAALTMIIPFWWMISTSFDNQAMVKMPFPPRFFPKEPSLAPYKVALNNVPLLQYMLNTLIVIVGVLVASGGSALMAGYSLSKIRFKGAGFVLMAALCVLMIPFEATMIPQFLLFNALGLRNSYWAFWLPGIIYVAGTFFAKQYMDSIPDALREASIIDGAGEFRTFFSVFLPLCGPIIATLTILLFLAIWNDFLWPLLIISDAKRYTIQVGVALFSMSQGTNKMPALRMATAVLSVLPVLTIYMALQRYIVESIAMSGIKQ